MICLGTKDRALGTFEAMVTGLGLRFLQLLVVFMRRCMQHTHTHTNCIMQCHNCTT